MWAIQLQGSESGGSTGTPTREEQDLEEEDLALDDDLPEHSDQTPEDTVMCNQPI
jgi:hypothetical protein